MIGYHFGYDLVLFLGVPTWLIFNPILDFLQPFFAGVFIFLSGVSSRFSRNNLKRGLLMLAAAAAITLVTYFIGLPVWFGIIHFLGAAAILFAFLRPAVDKISRPVQLVMYIALYVCAIQFTGRVYNVGWLWWLGFRSAGFSSADYFPILPWIFCFLGGSFLGVPAARGQLPKWVYKQRVPVLSKIGRHTLLIYILHQPVIYAVCYIVALLARRVF
jgi:uncharacterized membrane protein